MSKITHFDIGAWSREKAAKKQEIIAKNRTISELVISFFWMFRISSYNP